jgi:hypothetical protein
MKWSQLAADSISQKSLAVDDHFGAMTSSAHTRA